MQVLDLIMRICVYLCTYAHGVVWCWTWRCGGVGGVVFGCSWCQGGGASGFPMFRFLTKTFDARSFPLGDVMHERGGRPGFQCFDSSWLSGAGLLC